MRHLIILISAFFFTSCSILVSDLSNLRNFDVPENKTVTNIEIEIEESTEEPVRESAIQEEKVTEDTTTKKEEIIENIPKVPEEIVEEESHTKEETIIEETSSFPETMEENSETDEKIVIIETTEEVIVENDIYKITKKDDTYTIKNDSVDISFTKEYVVKNNRFIWIEENKSCVLEINGELIFLDYYNYSEIFLER